MNELPSSPTPPDGPTPPIGLFELFSPPRLLLLSILLVFLNFVLQAALERPFGGFAAALIGSGVVFVAFPWWLARRCGEDPRDTFQLYAPSASQWVWSTVLVVALMVPVHLLSQWNTQVVPIPEDIQAALEALRPTSVGGWILALVAACAVVPVGEELIFRGLIQGAAMRSMSPNAAAILCGLLFGVMHLQPWYLLGLSFLGVALGLAYAATGTLWTPIWMHALYNLISLGIWAWLTGEESGNATLILALGLGSLPLAAYALRRLTQKVEPTSSSERWFDPG